MEFLFLHFTPRRMTFVAGLAALTGLVTSAAWLAGGPGATFVVSAITVVAGLCTVIVGFAVKIQASVQQGLAARTVEAMVGLNDLWEWYTPYSARPDFLLSLARLVRIRRPLIIVEFGAGISTVMLAALLRQLKHQGRVIAFESDNAYMDIVKDQLRSRGLTSYVTLVHAPLMPSTETGTLWYDRSVVRDSLPQVDIAVVDGPPARFGKYIREAALPELAPYLSPGATIMLDDAKRQGERRILRRWAAVFPEAQIRIEDSERGTGVVTWPGIEQANPTTRAAENMRL